MTNLYNNRDICQDMTMPIIHAGATMAFFRKFAWIAGLLILAFDPLLDLFSLFMVFRARKDLDEGRKGSADPQRPDAYDMWPSLVPEPRRPNLAKMQTTELVMTDQNFATAIKSVKDSQRRFVIPVIGPHP